MNHIAGSLSLLALELYICIQWGTRLITALSEGSPSHRLRRIEQDWDSQKRRAENKEVSRESQARGYGEAGGEGLFFRAEPPNPSPTAARSPLPQVGEGYCQLIFRGQT